MEVNIKPTVKQYEAYQALLDPSIDTVFLGGGAGGGKSWLVCESRLINCYRYPGYKSFIGREELTRLMSSTYVTWTKVCRFHSIPHDDWKLNGQYHYIEFKNGSRIDLLDLKYLPSDPLYERYGSTEFSDGAFEEAGEINFMAYDVLKTRVNRHLNKELGIIPNKLITGNPKKNWTYQIFYKPYKQKALPQGTIFIQSLYKDNPHTADDYGKNLASVTDKQTRERLMFGNWEYEDDPNTLVQFDAITDQFTNTVPDGEKYISADIARYGSDKTVLTVWQGLKAYRIETYEKQDTGVTADKLKALARDEMVPYSHIIVDEDGIGGGVVDQMKGVKGFVANSTPIEKDRLPNLQPDKALHISFENLKAQCAYLLADKINSHQLAITVSDAKIQAWVTEELEQLKRRDSDKEGKLKIVTKEEMKEHLGRSPDFLDTMIMRMYFELVEVIDLPVNRRKPPKHEVFSTLAGI